MHAVHLRTTSIASELDDTQQPLDVTKQTAYRYLIKQKPGVGAWTPSSAL